MRLTHTRYDPYGVVYCECWHCRLIRAAGFGLIIIPLWVVVGLVCAVGLPVQILIAGVRHWRGYERVGFGCGHHYWQKVGRPRPCPWCRPSEVLDDLTRAGNANATVREAITMVHGRPRDARMTEDHTP